MKHATSPGIGITDQQTIPDGRENLTERSHRITIVDDDPGICEMMETLLTAWKFTPSVLPEPFSVNELLKIGVSTDIFLLDIRLSSETTINWIPKILDTFPEAKVIIMTGHADIDTVVQAIRNGAFDFFQKPIAPALMKHALLRAIQLQEKERRIVQMVAELQHDQALLQNQKQKLQFLNNHLLENNRAFSALARSLDFERSEIINQIDQKIGFSVIPALAKIRSDSHMARYTIEIDMIISMLCDLTSFTTSTDDRQPSTSMTSAEARVASLIKKGLTTDKIAEQLFISVDTVKTHRKNIRKKLNITNSQNGLMEYLSNQPSNYYSPVCAGKKDPDRQFFILRPDSG
jgi:FixJ family two-component response regulator